LKGIRSSKAKYVKENELKKREKKRTRKRKRKKEKKEENLKRLLFFNPQFLR